MANGIFQIGTVGAILALILWTGTQSSVSGQRLNLRSGYNETCNKTVKCKSQSWFACDVETETCRCVKPDEMVYDSSIDKCLVLVSERCKFGFEEDAVNSWYEKSDCVSGAVCSPSGICTCASGTYGDAEQLLCHPVKGLGEQCSSSVECNDNKMLSCVNGTCGCDPDFAIYNPTPYTGYDFRYLDPYVPSGVCIGRVGAACSSKESKSCVWNARCNNNVCQCRGPYSTTSNKLCGRGYLEDCSNTDPSLEPNDVCSGDLICTGTVGVTRGNREVEIKTTCMCPNPTYQDYDSATKSCRGRVGSPCDPTHSHSCTQKASCVERDSVFQCECDEGHIVTKAWKCQLGYGTVCNSNGNMMKIEETCDQVPSLRCIRGVCSCTNVVDVYEEHKRQCSVPVGLACKESSNCVTNAVCDNPTGEKYPGRCVCSPGFQMRKNQTCEVERIHELLAETFYPEAEDSEDVFIQ